MGRGIFHRNGMYLLTSADVEVVWLPLCEVLRLPRLPVARLMNYGGKRSRLSGIQSIALSISLCNGKRGGKSPINGGFNGPKNSCFAAFMPVLALLIQRVLLHVEKLQTSSRNN